MARSEATVEELVWMIEKGELQLPEMQRQYVWRSTRVRDLLDSLYRGYPSGAILIWETDEQVPIRDFAITQNEKAFARSRLLLDGQQRLTSLSAVIRGQPIFVRKRKRPVEILFNLEHPEQLAVVTEVDEVGQQVDDLEDLIEDEADATQDDLQQRLDRMTFVVSTQKLAALPYWVNVSEVFRESSDKKFLKRAGVTSLDDPRAEKYSQRLARLRAIRKYVYRMDVLERSLSYDEVTEIFVRVNSLGAKLRSSDLALAQITAKWRGALQIFQSAQNNCANRGFDLDLGVHLRNLVVFTTGRSSFSTVGGITVERLKEGWDKSVQGMEFAINLLQSNIGIDNPILLSSPFLLIVLGYMGSRHDYKISVEQAKILRQWALIANAKGRYSRGSSETILDQDIRILRDGGDSSALLNEVRKQVGNLEVVPTELEGRNQRSALFKAMFLAFRAGGATDWTSNLVIAPNHQGNRHRLQFHHIFPKAILKGRFTASEADDIANLAFISGRTNKSISAKAPIDYLVPLVERLGTAPFKAQCIPIDPDLLAVDRYKDFLVKRRELIAERLNEYLGFQK